MTSAVEAGCEALQRKFESFYARWMRLELMLDLQALNGEKILNIWPGSALRNDLSPILSNDIHYSSHKRNLLFIPVSSPSASLLQYVITLWSDIVGICHNIYMGFFPRISFYSHRCSDNIAFSYDPSTACLSVHDDSSSQQAVRNRLFVLYLFTNRYYASFNLIKHGRTVDPAL